MWKLPVGLVMGDRSDGERMNRDVEFRIIGIRILIKIYK